VRGKILSVVEEGLLINCNQAGNVFLKHYPGFSSELTDGASVACFAIPDGRYQYKAVSGAFTTVPALEYGRIFDPEKDHFALMSRFTQDGPVNVKVLSPEELAALKAQAETAKAHIKAKADDAVLKFQMEQAENGSPDNQYKMGLRYLTGEGVPANKSRAIDLLTKASAQGNKDAEEALAKANKNNDDIIQQTQLPIVSRSN
jgi:TPR repeat protein